ncbi:ATP-binding protein [Emticicia sp. W12TSBA100-4]|uniref:AAA family ATPase n=1 Tax=Emticicia sp. W12TSBA100-4 TaxID=3160965 RepID=UPI003305ED6C
MSITRLEAHEIGPFKDLNIEFKPKPAGMEDKAEIHILTGENGTGKSTILMMLASCWDKTNDKLVENRFWNKNTGFFYEFSEIPTKYEIEFEETKFTSFSGVLMNGKSAYYAQISQNDFRFKDDIKIRNNSPFFAYSGSRNLTTSNNISISEPDIDSIKDSITFDKKIDFDSILNWIAVSKAKNAFALLRNDNNSAKKHEVVIRKIEESISEILQKQVSFIIEEQPFQVFFKINDFNYDFNILPDGLKSIITWLSDLLMRLDRIHWADKTRSILEQNFILFLDEIEVHLHPSWQRKILPVVQDLFPKAQIFISTHSPFVVGSVDGARVYKFKLDENNNSVLDSEYWTEDGNSYDRILEEIFDIKERFGVGVQKQLDEFKEYKTKILKGETIDEEAFMKLASEIAKQSIELNGIISFELRQLKRNTTQKLETA